MDREKYKLLYKEVISIMEQMPKIYRERMALFTGDDRESWMKKIELQDETIAALSDNTEFLNKTCDLLVDKIKNTVLSNKACTKHSTATAEQSLLQTFVQECTLDENGNPEENIFNELCALINVHSQDILEQNKTIKNRVTKMKTMVKSKPNPSQRTPRK